VRLFGLKVSRNRFCEKAATAARIRAGAEADAAFTMINGTGRTAVTPGGGK
jgi:hypothetical protein